MVRWSFSFTGALPPRAGVQVGTALVGPAPTTRPITSARRSGARRLRACRGGAMSAATRLYGAGTSAGYIPHV